MRTKDHLLIYMIAGAACIILYCFSYSVYRSDLGRPAGSCFFVMQFGIACPACGGSHAIRSLLHGAWSDALKYNALAMMIFCCSVLVSLILIHDVLRARNSFIQFYDFISYQLKLRSVRYGVAIALIILWIINIYTYRS